MPKSKTLGILGAGKLGITVAQLAIKAGYKVYIAGSGDPKKIELSVKIIAPGAMAVTSEQAVNKADVVLLAMPLGKFHSLNPDWFKGKLVVDGMNHWPEVDGLLIDIIADGLATSEAVQQHLSKATVVKAFNHMGYHNLRDEAKLAGEDARRAIAVAGDNTGAVAKATQLVDDLGFDPLFIGGLKDSRVLQTGGAAFGVNVGREELSSIIGETKVGED